MTASRNCRACEATLSGGVMWCLRCYEPVRHLTPREPGEPNIGFLRREPADARSRWRAGATTFGPIGRLVVTALVLVLAPWSLNPVIVIVVWPAYLVIAILVLRDAWKRDFVVSRTGSRRSRRSGVSASGSP